MNPRMIRNNVRVFNVPTGIRNNIVKITELDPGYRTIFYANNFFPEGLSFRLPFPYVIFIENPAKGGLQVGFRRTPLNPKKLNDNRPQIQLQGLKQSVHTPKLPNIATDLKVCIQNPYQRITGAVQKYLPVRDNYYIDMFWNTQFTSSQLPLDWLSLPLGNITTPKNFTKITSSELTIDEIL